MEYTVLYDSPMYDLRNLMQKKCYYLAKMYDGVDMVYRDV